MRLLKLTIISLLLCGCETTTETVTKLRYYKDDRTNLCFVQNRTYYGYDVFANVPCTPEVEKLVGETRYYERSK